MRWYIRLCKSDACTMHVHIGTMPIRSSFGTLQSCLLRVLSCFPPASATRLTETANVSPLEERKKR
jgi:hypothetical protein